MLMAFTIDWLWPIEDPLRVRLDTIFTRRPRKLTIDLLP
jgi:hypothetical protein